MVYLFFVKVCSKIMKFFSFYRIIAFLLFWIVPFFAHNLTAEILDPQPYLLPDEHPLQPVLASLFEKDDVLLNAKKFKNGGFQTFDLRPRFHLRIARHPRVPGYVFKIYLDDENTHPELMYSRLVQRCIGASVMRKIVEENQFQHFAIPEKWVYKVQRARGGYSLILIAQDMQLASKENNIRSWKKKITKAHLRELYTLLSTGYGSIWMHNIPYTRNKKFTFIDFEYPPRRLRIFMIGRNLSPSMKAYWEQLCNQ